MKLVYSDPEPPFCQWSAMSVADLGPHFGMLRGGLGFSCLGLRVGTVTNPIP